MAGEREAQIMLVFAAMGVGKSHRTNELVKEYIKTHPDRKVLIFDPNDSDTYEKYYAIDFNIVEIINSEREKEKTGNKVITASEKNIMKLKPGKVYRIRPLTKAGVPMTGDQKKLTLLTICEYFKNGLIVIEDPNKYINNWQSDEILGAFKAIRHSSQDMILHMQSANPIPPVLYEAVTIYRIHYSKISLSRAGLKNRVAEMFEMLRIGQIIVEEVYLEHTRFPIGSKDYHKYKSYFVFVNPSEQKIRNCTKDQFIRACNHFLTQNKEYIKELAETVAFENQRSKPNHSDLMKAREMWIESRLRYLN